MTAPSYRFARRPRWIASHVLVAALIVAMATAGFWQLDRHRERSDRNELIEARAADPVVPLASVAPPGAAPDVGEIEQFRRVEIRGEYQLGDEVLVRNRTLDGAPGWWVLTPLLTEQGWAVSVNRGWIPLAYQPDEPRPGTEPPAGPVTIVGTVQPARQAEGFQRSDPGQGVLTSLARPDIERLAQQVAYELSPVVLQLEAGQPGSGPEPIALPLPPLDAGPHLGYAAQWFIFTTIAVIGYPLVLRKIARGTNAPVVPGD